MAIAQAEAGRRDSVLRLHLARDDADPRRDVDAALPLGQHVFVPDGRPRADRRIPARRRPVSQPVRRKHLRALSGDPNRVSVNRGRRRRTAADLDPLRRSGDVPGTQTSVPPDLQQGRVSRQRLHDPVRESRAPPGRQPTSSSSRGARSFSARCWRPNRRRKTASASPCWICGRSSPTTGKRSPSTSSARAA